MSAANAADDWWNTLPPDRRAQIHRGVDGPPTVLHVEGQYEIPLPPLEGEPNNDTNPRRNK